MAKLCALKQTAAQFSEDRILNTFVGKMVSAAVYAVVENSKNGVKAAKDALQKYEGMVRQGIPWSDYLTTMVHFRANKDQYSTEAAKILETVEWSLRGSHDYYKASINKVQTWCSMAGPELESYLSLFSQTSDSTVAMKQKDLITKVLTEGENAMNYAIEKLEVSNNCFNEAFGGLTTLQTVLDNDFAAGSDYYEAQKEELRKQAYAGAIAGAVFGPLGLAISYAIAAGVLEGDLIPAMEASFRKTKEMFQGFQDIVSSTQQSIKSARVSISQEIITLGTMSAKIKETSTFASTWALVPSYLFTDLKNNTQELVSMCAQFNRGV